MRYLTGFFYLLLLLVAVQVIYYYPQMPETMASHFDGLGEANAWSGRAGFFGLYLAMISILVGVFILVPRWSEKRARFGMKIPNAEYWLAPQRIDQTREFFRRQMIVMGVVHLLLTIITVQLVILANFDVTPKLNSSIVWVLVTYFLILAFWLAHFFWHFRKP